MRIENSLINIGYDKNGELDFGVSCQVGGLSTEKLKELREMICVAIYVMEDMWHRNQEKRKDCQNEHTSKTKEL